MISDIVHIYMQKKPVLPEYTRQAFVILNKKDVYSNSEMTIKNIVYFLCL